MIPFLRQPFALPLAFSATLTALLVAYLAVGLSPSPRFELLEALSWSLLLPFWVVADARRRAAVPCFDFGWFSFLFLPIVLPWHCFRSRGWRGALTLFAMVGLWSAPSLIAYFVWLAWYS